MKLKPLHPFAPDSKSASFARMQPILAQRLPQLAEIMKAHRVKLGYAFGSVCTDSFRS